MGTNYKHTQIGYLILFILAGLTLLFEFIKSQVGNLSAISVLMVIILFVLASFVSLQVRIDEENLRVKFGYGIFKKRFILKEIESVKIVKNKWYYGWGIRVWFWPRMIIYNVSGFDAVELVMKNGNIYRIGTDQPQELEEAIKQELK